MQPKISLITSGNLYMRQMRFENVGDIEIGHRHTYDHITLLSQGKLEVIIEDNESGLVYEAPSAIKILTGVKHKLVSHEAGTIAHCVHALRDAVTEDVLPANVVYTDEKVKAFKRAPDGILVRPTDSLARVDGEEVQVAFIAKVKEVNEDSFNMREDSEPLQVVIPS
jgi:quercetin dioxygenase-like cupin family protein